jgi:hypothetical protein
LVDVAVSILRLIARMRVPMVFPATVVACITVQGAYMILEVRRARAKLLTTVP